MSNLCVVCKKPGKAISRCCQKIWYCGQECADNHWSVHEFICVKRGRKEEEESLLELAKEMRQRFPRRGFRFDGYGHNNVWTILGEMKGKMMTIPPEEPDPRRFVFTFQFDDENKTTSAYYTLRSLPFSVVLSADEREFEVSVPVTFKIVPRDQGVPMIADTRVEDIANIAQVLKAFFDHVRPDWDDWGFSD